MDDENISFVTQLNINAYMISFKNKLQVNKLIIQRIDLYA